LISPQRAPLKQPIEALPLLVLGTILFTVKVGIDIDPLVALRVPVMVKFTILALQPQTNPSPLTLGQA
jgi:hypothetical protein